VLIAVFLELASIIGEKIFEFLALREDPIAPTYPVGIP
jgi:hypothetical protein